MLSRSRKACVAITALAVVLVSATCTSAGCLIVGDAQPVAAHVASCCQREHQDGPPKPAVPSDGRRCPICDGSNLIAKMVVKSAVHQGAAERLPAFFTPAFSATALVQSLRLCNREPASLTLAASPPTLLALHCALLN
jgi:hypothetical protein